MEFLEIIKEHVGLIVGLILFLIFLVLTIGLWERGQSIFGNLFSETKQTETLLTDDNVTIRIEHTTFELEVPKVYENNIIIDTTHPHTFKFELISSDNIFFEGKEKIITKPVLGNTKIPIYIDASRVIVKEQEVTVNVYLLDNNKEELFDTLTFKVIPSITVYLRTFPSRDNNEVIGVFDTPVPKSTLTALSRIAQGINDITIMNGQILMYIESRLDVNLVLLVEMNVTTSSEYTTSIGKIYAVDNEGQVKDYEFKPVDKNTQKLEIDELHFMRQGMFILLVPELKSGVYDIKMNLKLYYNTISEDTYIASKEYNFKVLSFPGDGFTVSEAVSLIVPYSFQYNSNIYDLLSLMISVTGALVGLQDKNYHLLGFMDYKLTYTPMPDTTLTEREVGSRYSIDFKTKTVSIEGIPKRSVLDVYFKSKDDKIVGFTQMYRVDNGLESDVYVFRYVLIDNGLTTEAFVKKSDNIKLLAKYLEGLVEDNIDEKEYFPLYYGIDNLVIVEKFGEEIKDFQHKMSLHTVCLANTRTPKTYYYSFLMGSISYAIKSDFSYEVELVPGEGHDCAPDTKFVENDPVLTLYSTTPFQTTYVVKDEYLFAYETYNTNFSVWLHDFIDWIKQLFGMKLTIGDKLHQERFVQALLAPDKFEVYPDYLTILKYDEYEYKKGEYTITVHVYNYISYPLDKAMSMANELKEKCEENPESC